MSKIRKKQIYQIPMLTAIAAVLGYWLIVFVVNANFHQVVAEKVYRSAQPSVAQLKKWLSQYKIKTVLNLRGDAGQITQDERAITDKAGIDMITIRLSAGKIPPKDTLTKLIQVLETAKTPMLIHCRAGADRSGTISALAAMAIGKENYNTAKWQSYVPPGWRKRKEKRNFRHISDTLRTYEIYCQQNGLDTAGWQQFKQWAADANSSFDKDVKYCYARKVRYADAVVKLARQAGPQFTIELFLLALLAVSLYRKRPKTEN